MKKIIGLFLVFFSVNCFAEWIFVSSTTDDTIRIYVDFSTKKKVGGYIRVWSLMDKNKTGEKVRSYKVLEEFDCSLDRNRVIQMSSYSEPMGNGNVINSLGGDNPWNYITPGSVEAGKFRRVCN
jgi:hypothetical protein